MNKHIFHYSITELEPYIDWSYFLHTWGLGCNMQHSTTAHEVINDSRGVLNMLNGKYMAHALFLLCDCRGDGDSIIIEKTPIPLLRQQHCIEDKPNLCLSDFLSPHGDKIGLFATTVDHEFGSEYQNDDYMRIITQALADRLAEAAASLLHKNVRTQKKLWGYSPDENLNINELNQELYQGIRPAIGYPSLPDQSIIFEINKLLDMSEIGIQVTSNGAMHPHSSVCGMMISHPQSRYFAVGHISNAQQLDYAQRRGISVEEIKKYLVKNI